MKNPTETYHEVYKLIVEGKNDQACALFIKAWQQKLISYLRRYRWTTEEALELIHDTYLMIEKKINNGELDSFNITYIKRCCKNFGANSWRKQVRKNTEFLSFAKKHRQTMNQEFQASFNLNLFEDEDDFSAEHRHALRAFDLMNERCRELIRLKHVDKLNHIDIVDKIASVSNINSSKTLLNRCMNSWKNLLEKVKAEYSKND